MVDLLPGVTSFLRTLLRRTAAILSLFLLLSGLAWWGDTSRASRSDAPRLRVALFINGTLGDKSFFDSAAKGLREAGRTLPVFAKVVEGGVDPTRWESAFTDLADSGDFDLIVTGTFTMVPYVQRLAAQYPRARFIVYDAAVDYKRCRCQNVHSLLFRQNEGAYLAGYLAALLDRRGLPGVPPGGGLGVVGGMQFPVIDDFIVGFRAGAKAVDPALSVLSQYANSFSDPAAGKEIAKAQYNRGASLIFHVAGATGQGVNEAALEAKRYAIGVDMDQHALYSASNPALAARIVTSVIKNVDVAILGAIRQQLAGTLPLGTARSLGVAERGVSLAPRSGVLAEAPPDLLAAVDAIQAEIVAGRIVVPSAFAPARRPTGAPS